MSKLAAQFASETPGKEVCSIEILKPLADAALARLAQLGYKNVVGWMTGEAESSRKE